MRCARPRALGAALLLGFAAGAFAPRSAAARPPLSHAPVVWYADDAQPIPLPTERDPNLLWDYFDDGLLLPLRRHSQPVHLLRWLGRPFGAQPAPVAAGLNSLDEVPNSSWFTHRIGLFAMDPASAARGPGAGTGPSREGPWTVVSAKSEGVTPGFVIRDAAGERFLVKFDPPGHLGMTTGAGVIASRILHAAGYNVPDDAAVRFRREDLVLDAGGTLRTADGEKRALTAADLEAILAAVEALPDGSYLAIASRFLAGRPLGPFDYFGRRKDDPNDLIPHEQRRELRGLRLFAAWLNHYDTKQHNSLDVYRGEPGAGHVAHYLIDFASTLGAGASGPSPRYGREYTLDLPAVLGRGLALGLYESPWYRSRRPAGLPELGYLASEEFDPFAFAPLQPNSAFAECTDRDAYWAAKIISAFTDAQLAAICAEAGYRDPAAGATVARILGERRDTIARRCFARVPPLDFFRVVDGELRGRDLGVERGVWPAAVTRYRVRLDLVDAEREPLDAGEWRPAEALRVALAERLALAPGAAPAFIAARWQADRGEGFGPETTVYISQQSGQVAALER